MRVRETRFRSKPITLEGSSPKHKKLYNPMSLEESLSYASYLPLRQRASKHMICGEEPEVPGVKSLSFSSPFQPSKLTQFLESFDMRKIFG